MINNTLHTLLSTSFARKIRWKHDVKEERSQSWMEIPEEPLMLRDDENDAEQTKQGHTTEIRRKR